MRYKTPKLTEHLKKLKEKAILYHRRRNEWIKTTVKSCEKYGDTVEVEQDSMNFYIKVTCPHQEALDEPGRNL